MLLYIFVSLSIIVMPGPDMIFVLTQSITSGKRAGIQTILGSLTGTLVHTLLAAGGLSIVIQKSPLAFTVIKCVGAIYLMYLAVQSFREKNLPISLETAPIETKGYFRKGMITNLSNPKMPIFFLTFLPQFVQVGSGHESIQIFGLGMIFIVETFVVFSMISLFAARVREKLADSPRTSQVIKYLKGTIFGGLGIRLLFLSR